MLDVNPARQQTTVMGIQFHKMNAIERAPFSGAAKNAFTADVGKAMLILEPTGIEDKTLPSDHLPRITEVVEHNDSEKEIVREWIMVDERLA